MPQLSESFAKMPLKRQQDEADYASSAFPVEPIQEPDRNHQTRTGASGPARFTGGCRTAATGRSGFRRIVDEGVGNATGVRNEPAVEHANEHGKGIAETVMKIGIIIGRIGDVDGVALETEKWIDVLKRMGHQIFILSGRFKKHVVDPENETLLPILSFFSPECEWEQNHAFFNPDDDPDELLSRLDDHSHDIATGIFSWVVRNKIEAILSENASALPCHLSMGMGLKLAAEHLDVPIVTHDHDFAWERGDRYHSPFEEIMRLVEGTFPLRVGRVRHAVINTAARDEVSRRFGIDAAVVPNVMDFDLPFAEPDPYNGDLIKSLGFEEGDICVFQITRIIERKGIEVAIDLVARLEDPRIRLVITGSAADDPRKGYFKTLVERVAEQGLEERVHFAHHRILNNRDTTSDGSKIYDLSDAYASATACTYFSTYEGFGNAFVEAVLARRPIFVNKYEPVFWPDIGSKGFECVMLEDNELTDQALEAVDKILHDPSLQREIAKHNFELGREHFSYPVLEQKLDELFAF
jgi:glycosyltransferase involved in cell wall biosynthesis